MKSKEGNVRFIRKRGRIIPIRVKAGKRDIVGIANSFANTAEQSLYLSKKFGNRAILLHELGHIKASNQKYSFNRYDRNMGLFLKKHRKKIKSGKAKISDRLKSFRKTLGYIALKPFTSLGSEAEATYHSIKATKKREGTKEALRDLATLAPAYGTYASQTAMIGFGGKGLYHGVMSAFVDESTKRHKMHTIKGLRNFKRSLIALGANVGLGIATVIATKTTGKTYENEKELRKILKKHKSLVQSSQVKSIYLGHIPRKHLE